MALTVDCGLPYHEPCKRGSPEVDGWQPFQQLKTIDTTDGVCWVVAATFNPTRVEGASGSAVDKGAFTVYVGHDIRLYATPGRKD